MRYFYGERIEHLGILRMSMRIHTHLILEKEQQPINHSHKNGLWDKHRFGFNRFSIRTTHWHWYSSCFYARWISTCCSWWTLSTVYFRYERFGHLVSNEYRFEQWLRFVSHTHPKNSNAKYQIFVFVIYCRCQKSTKSIIYIFNKILPKICSQHWRHTSIILHTFD